jgi:(1->4)-alpha-D-glucan 1-alpha-D-glucosylmutase
MTPSDATDLALRLFEVEASENPPRRPRATYRLQLHHGFRLNDLTAIVEYLSDLGISDVYLSPFLQARPDSTHGYDVFDHGKLNPEIGNDEDHARLLAKLAEHDMGRVLDLVPNHMGISGPNPFWVDVLECGPISPSARVFDIDWHPVKDELENRVLLPILEDQYGTVLENGGLKLRRQGGAFVILYHDRVLPLTPKSYERVLEKQADVLLSHFAPDDPDVLEYRSVWASAHNLPDRDELDVKGIETTLREKEVIKRRITRLCEDNPAICALLDQNVASFEGTVGDPPSWDALDSLLNEQVYRLAYWRVAADEINYRRFFDINDLAGLRTEDPAVFDLIHRLILPWVDGGGVTGLRIDHPDGLADPLGYFLRLQETIFLRACHQRYRNEPAEAPWAEVVEHVRVLYRDSIAGRTGSPLARRFPVVAEKILSRGEALAEDWPIDGTVGYEYLNTLNGLFIDATASDAIDATYAEFTGDREPFVEVLYNAKQLITRTTLASELNMLAGGLSQVSEGDRHSRDFTLNELRRSLRDVIASFPVYRTYVHPYRPITSWDESYIDQAIARARRRNATTDVSVFQFIKQALLLQHPPGSSPVERARREAFVARFQQITGPVQAKGLEDTSFYRQFPLASRNEVGGDPSRFGNSPPTFHALNAERLRRWPGGLSPTATHDTKRGEDTRIRINVLSELADEWRLHLTRWSRWNARKKASLNDVQVPDLREEYLLYQTLLGVWPFGAPDDAVPDGLVPRVQQYMVKAVREAKLNTSWTDTDPAYCDLLSAFISEILEGPDAGPFLRDFVPFQRQIARVGVVHSLAQTLIKLTSPGVPDVYQGCELWDLSLVDPDNRRPVDYGLRKQMLADLKDRADASRLAEMFANPDDGAIKLAVIAKVLEHRKQNRDLYAQGTYRAIEPDGAFRSNLIAFTRSFEATTLLTVAPRLVARMMGDEGTIAPIGPLVWQDTRILLPDSSGIRSFRDVLTGAVHHAVSIEGGWSAIDAGALFDPLPLALLVSEP